MATEDVDRLRQLKQRLENSTMNGNEQDTHSSALISAAKKVDNLEKTLRAFRAEVDMKLKIMQEILTNRNEQVTVQKKLLDREQNLYSTLLHHWMNTSQLAASGLSMNFSTEPTTENIDEALGLDSEYTANVQSSDLENSNSDSDPETAPASKKRKRRRKKSTKLKEEPESAGEHVLLRDDGSRDNHSFNSEQDEELKDLGEECISSAAATDEIVCPGDYGNKSRMRTTMSKTKPISMRKLVPKILDGEFFRVTSILGEKITAQCCNCRVPRGSISGSVFANSNFLNHLRRKHPEFVPTFEAKKRVDISFEELKMQMSQSQAQNATSC